MLAVIGTGVAKLTCCQPEAVSLVKVAGASSVPVLVQRLPTWVPVLVLALVEADAGDGAGDIGAELDADLDGGDRGRPDAGALAEALKIGAGSGCLPLHRDGDARAGVSRLPLSSTARLLIVTGPDVPPGVQV